MAYMSIKEIAKEIINQHKENNKIIKISELEQYSSYDDFDDLVREIEDNGYAVDTSIMDYDPKMVQDDEALEDSFEYDLNPNTNDSLTNPKANKTDDSTSRYFQDIGKIKRITVEEEKILGQDLYDGKLAMEEKEKLLKEGIPETDPKIKELDKKIFLRKIAIRKFVDANYRLVTSVAKKYEKGKLPLIDLIQEGNLGLCRGAEKYDVTLGYKFSTYATWWIRQSITRAIADQARTIRLPVHMNETINKVNKAEVELQNELGRTPTDEEIVKKLNDDKITTDKLVNIRRYSKDPISLEQPVGEEEDSSLQDFISDQNTLTPEEQTNLVLLKDILDKSLSDTLTEREEKVIRMRYGLYDGITKTLEQVGNAFQVTRERIRQIENKALKKLKQKDANNIREYYRLSRKK